MDDGDIRCRVGIRVSAVSGRFTSVEDVHAVICQPFFDSFSSIIWRYFAVPQDAVRVDVPEDDIVILVGPCVWSDIGCSGWVGFYWRYVEIG